MLAQSSDSAAAVLGIIIALAVIGLQIYLIYAIIATRQDVRVIRGLLGGGHQTPAGSWPTPPPQQTASSDQHQIDYYSQDGEYYCRTCGFTTRDATEAQQHRGLSPEHM